MMGSMLRTPPAAKGFPNMRTWCTACSSLLLLLVLATPQAQAASNAITVGEIEFDPSTLNTIGVSLPILSGDANYNATVLVSFRKSGTSAWKEALPLLRVRPETMSAEDPSPFIVAEQFAGSIFDLDAGDVYEVKLDVQDTDGGSATRIGTTNTRSNPGNSPAAPRLVSVSTIAALSTALSSASPGDIITLANGTYGGSITVSRSGTEANPIFIRGESRDGVILNASGAQYGITVTGSNVTVENLTVKSSAWGFRIGNTSNVVVRRVRITDVYYGVDARGGANRSYYICDNLLEGKGAVWPDVSNRTWDYEGIVVTGTGHVVCHNTLSGFGDSLSLSSNTSIPNRGIDFFGNDVLWGGDDGVELDFSERNVRAFRNRFSNVSMGISFQPAWGGPVYAFRNIIYNTANAPYKLNNDPSGFYILHNTSVRAGWAWAQYSGYAANFRFHNNVTIGTQDAVDMSTDIMLGQINYNGWSPNGQFRFTTTWNGFSSLQANSPYEHNGVLLNAPIFETSIPIPSTYTTLMSPLSNVTLHPNSNAVDAAFLLPNINDTFTGRAPDMGAWEIGQTSPVYGVRSLPVSPPSAPAGLTVVP
jgi:hypothetical protein